MSDDETVVSYAVPAGADADELRRTLEGLVDYLNHHFQFHGRRIILSERDRGPAAFADITADVPADSAMSLARNGVIGIGAFNLTGDAMARHRPYLWSVTGDCSLPFDAAVALAINRQLAGPIALITDSEKLDHGCTAAAQARAAQAGITLTVESVNNEQVSAIVQRANGSSVATVILGTSTYASELVSHAASISFRPQWITADRQLGDDQLVRAFDAGTWGTAIGVTDGTVNSFPTGTLGYEVYKTVRQDEPAALVDVLYERLYLLSIGLQLAGGRLDPASFTAGLRRYPVRIGPLGTWDTTQTYSATADVTVLTWDPKAASTSDIQSGTWITNGQRLTPDQLAGS